MSKTPEKTAQMEIMQGLADIATGKISHVYRGICPDALEGHDKRDDECPACKILMRYDALKP